MPINFNFRRVSLAGYRNGSSLYFFDETIKIYWAITTAKDFFGGVRSVELRKSDIIKVSIVANGKPFDSASAKNTSLTLRVETKNQGVITVDVLRTRAPRAYKELKRFFGQVEGLSYDELQQLRKASFIPGPWFWITVIAVVGFIILQKLLLNK